MGLRLEPKLQQGRDRLMRTSAQGCLFVGVQEPCITFRGPNTGEVLGSVPPAPRHVLDVTLQLLFG